MCLLVSDLGSNKALGPVGSIGIAFAMLSALTFLPAMLTVDPANSRVYVMDSAMGLAAAYAFDQDIGV